MKLKVLEVPFWATIDEETVLECVEAKIPPILNRYGIYIDRLTQFCWIECEYGCFLYNKGYESFIYELKLLNHKPLTTNEVKAIRTLQLSKLSDKYLNDLVYTDFCWKNLKDISRRSRHGRLTLIKGD